MTELKDPRRHPTSPVTLDDILVLFSIKGLSDADLQTIEIFTRLRPEQLQTYCVRELKLRKIKPLENLS